MPPGRRFNRPVPLAIPGLTEPLHLSVHGPEDVISRALAEHGVWEPFETSVFLGLLRPGDTVADVGANLGYYTVLAAQAVGPGGTVHAIEPDPANLALLRENVALNRLGNVQVHPVAASDHAGEAQLHLDAVNRGDHRLYASNGEVRAAVTVLTTALDGLLPEAVRLRLIKIDAQGSELAIFRGMQRLLAPPASVRRGLLARRDPGLRIITEIWPYGLREAGGSHGELLDLLRGFGFRLSLIDEAAQRLEAIGYAALAVRLATPWYAEQRGFVNVLLE